MVFCNSWILCNGGLMKLLYITILVAIYLLYVWQPKPKTGLNTISLTEHNRQIQKLQEMNEYQAKKDMETILKLKAKLEKRK